MSPVATIVIVVLLIALVVSVPEVGMMKHSYGYWPGGALGTVLIILLVLALFGKI